jgi:hypothetical protein
MKKTVLIILIAMLSSCVEEIDFVEANETFESALVIEATITNELKQQQIILSRTYAFEEEGSNPESGAAVTIESSQGIISFSETAPGIYLSDVVFAAQNNVDYQLKITTNNGSVYSSNPEQLASFTDIDNVVAVRENNNLGENGMAIYVDSFDPTGNSKYYRYTYEETYKVIAPDWKAEELIVTGSIYPDCTVDLVNRVEEAKTCYSTKTSTNINLVNTNVLSEDRVSNHLIRFINSEDFILTYRYSILVKQYIQSLGAYSYYKALNEFSSEGSIFSQTQPGFLSGNIVSETNSQEKVVGFFDVSTVSEKRIFFNYEDFYPGEPKPLFITECNPYAPELVVGIPPVLFCGELITGHLRNKIVYYDVNEFPSDGNLGPYFVVVIECGDCRSLGSNEIPDFWEE